MRLREIYDHLTIARQLVDTATRIVPGTTAVILVNQQHTRDGLERLHRIPVLQNHAAERLADAAMIAPSIESRSFPRFKSDIDRLMQRAEDLRNVIEQLLSQEDSHSISIQIPKTTDLDGLLEVARNLQMIFEHPAKRLFGAGVWRLSSMALM